MNDLDTILNEIIKEKGGNKDDYRLIMDSIAFHESAGTLDPSIKQIGGGPGRGKYQFEVGRHEGGITAAKRTTSYLKSRNKKIPQWLKEISSDNDLDVSNLTSEQQDILFLGNMRMHPKADFKDVINNNKSIKDFWADYHWAGLPKERNKKIEAFNSSFDKYVNTLSKKEENTQTPVSPDIEGFKPIDYNKAFGYGGNTRSHMKFPNQNLNSFDNGGSHESNPYGGIPQGKGSNGKMNTVEQGETSFDIKGSKFIFSDRIDTGGKISGKYSTNNYFLGGNMNNTDPKKNSLSPPKKSNVLEQKNKAFKWVLNPTTNKRLKSNLEVLGKDPNKSESMISKAVDNIKKVEVEHTNFTGSTEGEFSGNLIKIHPTGTGKDKVMTHELTHAGGLDKTLTDYIRKQYGSPFTNYTKNLAEKEGYQYNPESYKYEKEGAKSHSALGLMQNTMSPYGFDKEKSMMDYLNKHGKGELYPRFQEMRNFLNVSPGDEITDDHIKALQSDKDMQFMFKYYKPEVIKQILNTVASQNNNLNKYQGLV